MLNEGNQPYTPMSPGQLWFPVLERHEFTNLIHATCQDREENAINAIGYDERLGKVNFMLRSRDSRPYSEEQLRQYRTQLTIRYASNYDDSVEWDQFFHGQAHQLPNYMAYGWDDGRYITDYFILNVSTLIDLHREGHLEQYCTNTDAFINAQDDTFIPIPIDQLLQIPLAERLVIFQSDNPPPINNLPNHNLLQRLYYIIKQTVMSRGTRDD